MSKGLKQWIEDSYKNSNSLSDEDLRDILFKPEPYEYKFFLGVESMKRLEEIFKEEIDKYGITFKRKKNIRKIN